jgi:hypothetical protein
VNYSGKLEKVRETRESCVLPCIIVSQISFQEALKMCFLFFCVPFSVIFFIDHYHASNGDVIRTLVHTGGMLLIRAPLRRQDYEYGEKKITSKNS